MKGVMRFLAAAALIAAPLELQRNLTRPVQPGASRPSPARWVLKPIPFSAAHRQHTGGPRRRISLGTTGNWSGYAVPLEGSSVSDTFSEVAGTWIKKMAMVNSD
jgi:hypothetical protein